MRAPRRESARTQSRASRAAHTRHTTARHRVRKQARRALGGDVVSPEPGWYPEPTNPSLIRFWDGSAWSAQRVWTGSEWVESAPGLSPRVGVPPAVGPLSLRGTFPAPPPPAQRPRSLAGKKLW